MGEEYMSLRKATTKSRQINCWSYWSSGMFSFVKRQRNLCGLSLEAQSLSSCKTSLTWQREMVLCLLYKQLSERNVSALKALSCSEFPQQKEIVSVCGHCLICHHMLYIYLEMSHLSTHVYNYCVTEK